MAHLLDRFYQVDGIRHKKAQTGGLGLSIVQSIVKLHGGWVEVENQRKGVVFKVVLLFDFYNKCLKIDKFCNAF